MFRFTIRELVLLTLVVAMGVGWWLEHRQHVSLAERHHSLGAAYALTVAEKETLDDHLRRLMITELNTDSLAPGLLTPP